MSTVVWRGGYYFIISPYNVVQHQYARLGCEDELQGGYAELLEIVGGPQDKPFVVHLFLNHEGSSYFTYNNLEFAKVGYQHCLGKGFVRSRDLWLRGCLSWDHIGHNLPWFYTETKEGAK